MIVFGVQASPPPSHITLIDVSVAQLGDVNIEMNIRDENERRELNLQKYVLFLKLPTIHHFVVGSS